MIDLHCHLLPGVDDGVPALDEAVELARELVEAGFSIVAASPHVGMGPGGHVLPAVAAAKRDELRGRLEHEGIELELLPNAEHHVSPELFAMVSRGEVTPIGGTGPWLLTELPWEHLARVDEVLFRLQAKGYALLLAHPERHGYLSLDELERLHARGVRLQVELGSLVEVYGGRAKLRARELFAAGLASVVATDLHRARQAQDWLGGALAELERLVGAAGVEALLVDNPRRILDGSDADELVRVRT